MHRIWGIATLMLTCMNASSVWVSDLICKMRQIYKLSKIRKKEQKDRLPSFMFMFMKKQKE